jgi:two-component system, LytTR family, response regulator AlgR
MRILIADDEPLARSRLRALIEEIGPPWQVVAEAADGASVLARCAAGDLDLVLLDIRMPGLDGMAAAARLRQLPQPPVVIFTTAYADGALDAFDQQAVDYLLKPVRRQRLEKALDKARGLSRVQRKDLEARHPEPTQPAICVRQRGELHRIPLEDILYFRAEDKYVVVRHRHGEALLEESLKSLEQRLGDHFLRVHRNTLIHLAYLQSLQRDAEGRPCVRLRGGDQCLEVSRRLLPGLRQRLLDPD